MSTTEARMDEEAAFRADRRLGLGGSDAPIVMGVSPYRTRYMLWAEKRGLIPHAPPNPAMARGTALEPVARAAYEREVGGLMFPCQMTHPEYPWMRANLDGLSPDATTFLEVKCPGQVDHALALKGEVPLHYMPQLQHYFAVTQ